MLPVSFDGVWSQINGDERLNWLHKWPALKECVRVYARDYLLLTLGPWLDREVTEETVSEASEAVAEDMINRRLPEKMFEAIQKDLDDVDEEIDEPFSIEADTPDIDKAIREAVAEYRKTGVRLTIAEFLLMEPYVFLRLH